MNWLESIRINIGRGRLETETLGVIKTLANELASVPSLEWECYRNPSVPGDILIVLRWPGDPPSPMKSDIALALARELRKHGLVDHTVWINMAE